ncbi:DNA polymerase III subunit delta [Sphingomonas sp.]|uniref:DNA polymerase III subunit delta n=1 Tax=Sphingomonas sp. TaxID=28214 RepID=UPI002ED969E8
MKATFGQIRTALDRPSPDVRLYLLHGPDEAAASELAVRLGHALGTDAERVDLDAGTLKSDPARLADEAASLSLFGGVRFIRAGPIGDESHEALAGLLSAERAGNPVVALAPTVRTTAKIVKLAIESPRAIAFGCYLPEGEAADRIVLDIARAHGLRTNATIARRIAEGCSGDRAVMTREIEKLALYLDADTDRPADLDDAALDAVGADLGEAESAHVVEALVDGHSARLGAEIARLEAAGTSPIPWLRAITRRLIVLAEMRAEIDGGDSLDSAMKRHRIFRGEEAATARAVRRWSPAMLAGALARVRTAERAVMTPGNAGSILADAAMLTLARDVERRG